MQWQPMVPELVVSDFARSLRFYRDTLGFELMYQREDPAFAYLQRERAQLMIEQQRDGCWLAGELHAPFGRGVNFQIECTDVAALRAAVRDADVFLELEEAWYETGETSEGQRQFIVADPDGYLLRFCQPLEQRDP